VGSGSAGGGPHPTINMVRWLWGSVGSCPLAYFYLIFLWWLVGGSVGVMARRPKFNIKFCFGSGGGGEGHGLPPLFLILF